MIPTPVRTYLRSWQCPALEMRNRALGFRAESRNRDFQSAEIARLRAELGTGAHRPARVQVVIPTYQRPALLVKAVQSALAQTFRDLVVVVVDDGAGLTDDLPKDPRLIAVSLSRNCATAGLVRNVGISLADSEFIAFLDDDNVWTPDHIDKTIGALDADSSLAAVYSSVRRYWPDGSILDVLDEPFDRREMRTRPYIDTNSIVVRRTFDPGFSVLPRSKTTVPAEDWEYMWRLSKRAAIKHVADVTVLYQINPESYFTNWTGD